MINEMMTLRDLVEKHPDTELLREMIVLMAEWLMEPQVLTLQPWSLARSSSAIERSVMVMVTKIERPEPGPQNCAT
jgi:hypothetical protein